MEFEFNSEEIHLAAQFIINNSAYKVVLFNGEMGAGKTTVIKEMAKLLGVKGATSSPTFSLVNEYQINDHENLYHFDLYRLESEVEALDFGIEDYLDSNHWCFIEWPEKIASLLPEYCTSVDFKILDHDRRSITIS